MANFFRSVLSSARAILQRKTVTPTTSVQVITPDSGYDGLEQVTVNAISATSVSPSSSGTYFSSGLKNMTSSGYAYSSRPSQQSGYMSSGTTLWSDSPSSQSVGTKTLSNGSFSSYEWLEFVFKHGNTSYTEQSIVWARNTDFMKSGMTDGQPGGVVGSFRMSSGAYLRRVYYISNTSFGLMGESTGNNSRCILIKVVGHNIYP